MGAKVRSPVQCPGRFAEYGTCQQFRDSVVNFGGSCAGEVDASDQFVNVGLVALRDEVQECFRYRDGAADDHDGAFGRVQNE